MLEENVATTSSAVAEVKISSYAPATSSSEPRDTGTVDVGAVGEERQDAVRSERREAMQVEVPAVERRGGRS